jgi:uncharacterized protein (TIGR00661 family)
MKLLYGISGIGTGHSNRQMPIIEHFARDSEVAIFCYDESHRIYSKRFADQDNVTIIPIDIPFIAGNLHGLDWEETARVNRGKDFNTINSQAMAKAQEVLGRPDLVVTDYEPLSAQYAYAHDAPLVTLDQQSKYLLGHEFPEVEGQSFQDEIMRLRMFFPTADARVACSFFQVDSTENRYGVTIFPPTLKDQIVNLDREEGNSVLMYVSSQKAFVQSLDEVMEMCAAQDEHFDIFLRDIPELDVPENVTVYQHGAPRFYDALRKCKGIVSTAGHTLFSEAMYLGIPVYAIPLPVYEQHMNAHVMEKHGFGVSRPKLDRESLEDFLGRIPEFKAKIEQDDKVLLRRDGQPEIIAFLEQIAGGRK